MAERTGEPSAAGTPFGRYLLDELIARGGMGEVFRAKAIGAGGFEKPVVVKRILPSLGGQATLSAMFIEEARLMSRLVHPNIVQVIDFGQGDSDDYFLVMELVDGVDLRVFGKAHEASGMPAGLAALIVTQILRGLHHAHTKAYGDARTLVHRDVSPGNVLLSRVGEVKVADFGVALVARPDGEGPRTMAGKLGYMAPEQVFGDAVDQRADVFSVGVVFHQLLTGGPAFVGDDEAQQQASAAIGRVRDVLATRPDVGEDLAAVITQALAPEPDARFASARAMSKAIEAACRASGIEVATADDLAEHVERIADARAAKKKKVVAVGDDAVKRQLTRTGAFTMKFSAVSDVTDVTSHSTIVERSPNLAAEPDSEVLASNAQPTPAPVVPLESRGGWLGLGAVALVGVAATIAWLSLRGDPESTTASSAQPSAPSPSAERSPPMPSSRAVVPQPSVPSTAPSSVPTHDASVPVPVIPRPAWSAPTKSSAPAPPSPPPATGCKGKVLLSSRGSWWVSGGPSGRVQSPGMYTWRCGSYGLTGTSRVDGKVVSRSVSVRDGATASARFE